jgi:hypothetical protein
VPLPNEPHPIPDGSVTFIDKVVVWLTEEKLPRAVYRALKDSCGELNLIPKPMKWRPQYRRRLDMKQPEREAFEILLDIQTRQAILINSVEVALDLVVRNQDRMLPLRKFIDQHIMLPRRRVGRVEYRKHTRYAGPRRWPSQNNVVYSDRPSKLCGLPCVHIERRALGRQQVRTLGLPEPEDLLNLDYGAFWRKRLVMCEIDWDALVNQYVRSPEARRLGHARRTMHVRVRARLRNQARNKKGDPFRIGPSAQDVHDTFRCKPWYRKAGVLKPLQTDAYIPTAPYDSLH